LGQKANDPKGSLPGSSRPWYDTYSKLALEQNAHLPIDVTEEGMSNRLKPLSSNALLSMVVKEGGKVTEFKLVHLTNAKNSIDSMLGVKFTYCKLEQSWNVYLGIDFIELPSLTETKLEH